MRGHLPGSFGVNVTVMVASPTDVPVIIPFSSTIATVGLEVEYVMVPATYVSLFIKELKSSNV